MRASREASAVLAVAITKGNSLGGAKAAFGDIPLLLLDDGFLRLGLLEGSRLDLRRLFFSKLIDFHH